MIQNYTLTLFFLNKKIKNHIHLKDILIYGAKQFMQTKKCEEEFTYFRRQCTPLADDIEQVSR